MTTVRLSATMEPVLTFNTEGPVVAADHYHIPPLERIDLDDVLGLVRGKKYFVLHAPRQTGKTSALLALRDLLNGGTAGEYRCVYANVEDGQATRENVAEGMRTVLAELALQASLTLGDDTLEELWPAVLERVGPAQALRHALLRWSMADPRPLVLLIDEIDALVGDTLLSVLRQLRTGYVDRPVRFPQSIVLCGVRDVRDYRIHSTAENRMVLGGSAFNIKAKSLRLGDFSQQEVRALLAQHTAATGQAFTEQAVDLILTQTAGQPWLVNALCREACFDDEAGRDRSRLITERAILEAQERLILARVTHLDNLADKLREERVRRVVEPLLTGAVETVCSEEDLAYVRDLGLLAPADGGPPRIANPVYAEVVPRHLSYAVQETLPQQTTWYVSADGALDVPGLLAAFQQFFREHSEHWVQRFERYHEAGPQLLLQAHLQRIVNGGGRIEREYALGRGRTDLLIVWPQDGAERRFVVECKVLRKDLKQTIAEGVEQTRGYMDRCGAESGHLILFDRAPDRTWADKFFRRPPSADGAPVTVWGM
ncbi:MAG: AAA-like domain-containing protein [Spirochaetaceae bacterium]|nr:AAA-like domain-containing protein [Spirochaetaceae bacterium]